MPLTQLLAVVGVEASALARDDGCVCGCGPSANRVCVLQRNSMMVKNRRMDAIERSQRQVVKQTANTLWRSSESTMTLRVASPSEHQTGHPTQPGKWRSQAHGTAAVQNKPTNSFVFALIGKWLQPMTRLHFGGSFGIFWSPFSSWLPCTPLQQKFLDAAKQHAAERGCI